MNIKNQFIMYILNSINRHCPGVYNKLAKLKQIKLFSVFLDYFNIIPKGMEQIKIISGPLKGYRFFSDLAVKKSYILGTHEPNVTKLVSQITKPGFIVYDVGAHWGYYSLLFGKLVGEQGLVFAFEPFPFNVEILRKNIIFNKARISIVPKAVDSASGTGYFTRYPYLSSRGKIEKSFKNNLKINTVSLDDFVKSNPAPNVIKIDVEGGEVNVLEGMRTILERRPHIIIELHENNFSKVVEILKNYYNEIYFIFDVLIPVKTSTNRSSHIYCPAVHK